MTDLEAQVLLAVPAQPQKRVPLLASLAFLNRAGQVDGAFRSLIAMGLIERTTRATYQLTPLGHSTRLLLTATNVPTQER